MNFKLLFVSLVCLAKLQAHAQIKWGKIVYERKTNLLKKYKDDDDMKEWIASEEKLKVDMFVLYFTDSNSVFMPQESDIREKMSWTTSKNVVYQKLNQNKRLTIKTIWGEKAFVEDTLYKRIWKITDSKRIICGYSCRKAIWQANDSVRIYAWYSDEIITNVGPESFFGLPGAILGLATEDGGVIYFAKSVQQIKPDMVEVIPKIGKNKVYSSTELKTKLEKDFGKNKWGKQLIAEQFGLW